MKPNAYVSLGPTINLITSFARSILLITVLRKAGGGGTHRDYLGKVFPQHREGKKKVIIVFFLNPLRLFAAEDFGTRQTTQRPSLTVNYI